MYDRDVGSVILNRLVHSWKALSPIETTLVVMSIPDRLEQCWKAKLSMEVTPEGSVILDRLEQP